MILKEDVLCIVLMIEECEGDRAFGVGMYAYILTVHTILFQEVDDDFPHMVVAGFGYEACRYANASQRDETVERGAAGRCCGGDIFFENYIEYGFAYSYYLSHSFLDYVCFEDANLPLFSDIIAMFIRFFEKRTDTHVRVLLLNLGCL
jgi:hypothetical protein